MSNEYFEFDTGRMVAGEDALAEDVNAAIDGVVAGFEKLPTPDDIKFMSAGYAVTGGSSSNYTLAVTADAYFDGMMVAFKANHANSGAATLNVNSLGAKSLISMGGGGALVVGDVLANHIYMARYNSTSASFELQGLSAGSIGDVQTVAVNITDIITIADNIDEVLLADDSATAAASSASAASGYASDASDSADAAATSAANLPNASTAGSSKLIKTNSSGNGWEYPAVTAAGLALLDDTNAAAQLTTLGITAAGQALLDDASADAQLTTLGVTAAGKALLDDASASDQLTTLGVSSAGKAILDDASASDQLTTLGVTAAGKALLDDASAADQRTTLGLGNVNNTSDANKPISSATQTALDAKYNASGISSSVAATYGFVSCNGVVIQVLTTTFTGGVAANISFPTAFPTACMGVSVHNGEYQINTAEIRINNWSTSAVNLQPSAGSGNMTVTIIAVGY